MAPDLPLWRLLVHAASRALHSPTTAFSSRLVPAAPASSHALTTAAYSHLVITTAGARAALPYPSAQKPKERSSRHTLRRARGCSAAASASGDEREPGAMQNMAAPCRHSSSTSRPHLSACVCVCVCMRVCVCVRVCMCR